MHTKCMFLVWFEHSAYSFFALLLYISTCFYIFFFCLLHVSCLLFLHPSSRHIPRISPSAESECSSEEGACAAAAVSSSTLATVVASHFGYSFSSDDAAISVLVHERKCAALGLRDSIIVFHTYGVLSYRT